MRAVVLTFLAAAIGLAAGAAAVALLKLIGLITNLSFYGRLSASFVSPAANQLGLLVLVVPVIGGVLVGLMARYGSEAIRGHGIPEAMLSAYLKTRVESPASRSSQAHLHRYRDRYGMSLWCRGPNHRHWRSDWLSGRPDSLDHC